MVREKSIVKLEKNSWPSSSIVPALLPASNRTTGVTVNGRKKPAGSLLAILSLQLTKKKKKKAGQSKSELNYNDFPSSLAQVKSCKFEAPNGLAR